MLITKARVTVLILLVLGGCAGSRLPLTPLESVARVQPPPEDAPIARDSDPVSENVEDEEIVVTGSQIIRSRKFVVAVNFATDRDMNVEVGEEGERYPSVHFGARRGETLHYGLSYVSIPASTHVIGNIERPRWWKLERTADPAHHMVLSVTRSADFAYWISSIKRSFKAKHRPLLLFVHGYNVSFDEGVLRAAQMAWDVRFPGPVVLYSWASKGKVAGYPADEATAELAVTNLTEVLRRVLRLSNAGEIYLVAHSMGNRILTRALLDVAVTDPSVNTRVKDVILAAPDIDADVFKAQIAPRLPRTAGNVTIYASSTDEALRASRKFHGGYARVGDTNGGVAVFPGIHTIDASSEGSDFLGHSYITNSPRVLVDLRNIINTRLPPQARGMLRMRSRLGTYWRFPVPDAN